MEYPAYVAALDIGGTKIAGALLRYEQIDAAPEVVFETQVPTQAQRGGGPVDPVMPMTRPSRRSRHARASAVTAAWVSGTWITAAPAAAI